MARPLVEQVRRRVVVAGPNGRKEKAQLLVRSSYAPWVVRGLFWLATHWFAVDPSAAESYCVKTVSALSLNEDKRYYARGSAGADRARFCGWVVRLERACGGDRPGATAHGSVLRGHLWSIVILRSTHSLTACGTDFFPKDGKELKVAVEEIVHDLHAQYLVGYERSSNRKKDFPKITVSITSKSGELLRSIVRVLQ